MASSTTRVTFLSLPVELRLQIYALALNHHPVVTISVAKLSGSHSEIIHRLYGDNRTPYYGIPTYHVPVIEPRYNESLLSITKPALVPATDSPRLEVEGASHISTCPPLLLVNRQIYSEMKQHFPNVRSQGLSLFVSYPYGLHVLTTLAPHLLFCASKVHITGQYIPDTFNATHAANLPTASSTWHSSTPLHETTTELASLIAPPLGSTSRLRSLYMRIYYPGPDSNSVIYGDDSSPIVIALKNICAGRITIEIWRGRNGNGGYLAVTPSQDGKRHVSSVGRRLNEGKYGEKEATDWAIDSKWLEEMSRVGGGGDGDGVTEECKSTFDRVSESTVG